MAVRTMEHRRHNRMAASYVATLRSESNRFIARGRTANISEGGVLVVVRREGSVPNKDGRLFVDLVVPADPLVGTQREVTYLCRIVRRQELANLLGLGLEFIRKVG